MRCKNDLLLMAKQAARVCLNWGEEDHGQQIMSALISPYSHSDFFIFFITIKLCLFKSISVLL